MSSARSLMNCRPKLRRPRPHGAGLEAAPVVADLEDPLAGLGPTRHDDLRRRRMLAHILKGLLHDAQDDRLLRLAQLLERHPDVATMVNPVRRACARWRRASPVEAHLGQDRRSELGDEAADVAELAPQQLAQEAQLVAPMRGRGR